MGVLVLAACTLGAGVAHSEPFHEAPPDEVVDAVTPTERWYGWQTLSVDALPIGLLITGITVEGDARPTLLVSGATTFAVGAPVVHMVHDRPLIGLASFGLRVGLPVLGIAVGSAFYNPNISPDIPGSPKDDSDDGALPLVVGGLIGVAGASALDAGLLAYETSPESAANDDVSLAPPLGVSFMLANGGGRVAVLGAF